jgi:S-adenosylmethionine-dependent methyltransferase
MSKQRLAGPKHARLPALSPYSVQSLPAFDARAEAWEDYTHTPLGQLRQELTQCYLAQHLGALPPRLAVLDAGGGTGGYALPLAQKGHQVCLLDCSSRMLAVARRKVEKLDPSLVDRLSFCQASVHDIPALLGAAAFDLILCHTLLEYVQELWPALRALTGVLKPGGLLSLLLVNPWAAPLRWAIAKGDLEQARLALGDPVLPADLFGLPRRALPLEALREALTGLGMGVVAEYGVRIFADYVAEEQLVDPESYARLLDLEMAASTIAPYRQIARYNLILAEKAER